MPLPLALVWDNDPALRSAVGEALEAAGFSAVEVEDAGAAIEAARGRAIALAVAGSGGPAGDTLALLQAVARLRPTAGLAWIDADPDACAERAARAGILEVLPRPPRPERLKALAVRALAHQGLLEDLRRLRGGAGRPTEDEPLVGRSAAIARLRDDVERVAAGAGPVLVVGEPGSGRTHVARVIHAHSRSEGDFEIHERLPAARDRAAGTWFAREIEAWPWADQAALLAASHSTPGVRLVVSTSLDPARAADEGRLHPDLAAAAEGAAIRVPPLRERPEDVSLLARAFVERLRRLNGLPAISIEPGTLAVLERQAWHGNVKELRDVVETAVILAADGIVRARDLPGSLRGAPADAPLGVRSDRRFRAAKRAVVDAFERAYLTDLLGRHGGNVTGAAEHSGMLRSALQRLLRKHELRSVDFRRRGPDDRPVDAE